MSTAAADPRPSNRFIYGGIAALIAMSIVVQVVRERTVAPSMPPDPALWLKSGRVADNLFLGYKNLVADIYWMRAVVYYGSQRKQLADLQGKRSTAKGNFDLLYPLLDLVTTLDPHFKVAYRFGAIFLTEAYPSGPGRPDQAIALLQRGIERDGGRWEYFEDIGFVYYWWVKDFDKAAEWFKRASEQPDAPSWLAPLAATTLAAGGNRQSSRLLWTQMLNSDIDWLRRDAGRRLQQLDAMDQMDDLNRRLRRFVDQEGKRPTEWRQLGVPGAPLDPSGTPYRMDPKTGLIDLDPGSSLLPLPR